MASNLKHIRGDWSHEVLRGTAASEYINGEGGDDYIFAGDSFDTIWGGSGDDWLYGQGGNDDLTGESGDDNLAGGKGNDWLNGGEGADRFAFRLGDGFDYIYDLQADDTIVFVWGDGDAGPLKFTERDGEAVIVYGDGGTDDGSLKTLFYSETDENGKLCYTREKAVGGDGGGTVTIGGMSLAEFKALGMGITAHGGDGDNTLHGTFGRDTLHGGKGDDKLKGKSGNDRLHGEEGDDKLMGHKGDDMLAGGGGDDILRGGRGDDLLAGMTGDDMLWGGRGADLFSFRKEDGADIIRDFQDGDKIRFVEVGHGYDGLTITNDANGNAVVTYGGGQGGTITLLNVDSESLTESDFLFA